MGQADKPKYVDEAGIILNQTSGEPGPTIPQLSHEDAVARANRQGANVSKYTEQINTTGHSKIDRVLRSTNPRARRFLTEHLGVLGIHALNNVQPRIIPINTPKK